MPHGLQYDVVLRDGSTFALRDARDTDLAALTAFVKRFRRIAAHLATKAFMGLMASHS